MFLIWATLNPNSLEMALLFVAGRQTLHYLLLFVLSLLFPLSVTQWKSGIIEMGTSQRKGKDKKEIGSVHFKYCMSR